MKAAKYPNSFTGIILLVNILISFGIGGLGIQFRKEVQFLTDIATSKFLW